MIPSYFLMIPLAMASICVSPALYYLLGPITVTHAFTYYATTYGTIILLECG